VTVAETIGENAAVAQPAGGQLGTNDGLSVYIFIIGGLCRRSQKDVAAPAGGQ